MFGVGGGDMAGPIAGPPGAGDGGGSSGTALTGPTPNASAAAPMPTVTNAVLVMCKMSMVFVSSPIFQRWNHLRRAAQESQFAEYPNSGLYPPVARTERFAE